MILVNNLTGHKVSTSFLRKVAKIVLSGENIKKGGKLSIVLVKAAMIKKLNRRYREQNQATDVLSFEGDKKLLDLGEVVVCLREVKKNAKVNKTSFQKELGLVLIHSILHLLGYDHRKTLETEKMRKKQEYYLRQI